MIKVRFYKTASKRKKEQVFGVFYPETTVAEVKPIDETLKGKKLAADKERFKADTEQVLLNAKFMALDEVREYVGEEGVLVAEITDEPTVEEIIGWISEHPQVYADFKAKFPEIAARFEEGN